MKVLNGLVIAVADFYQVPREFVGLRVSLLDVSGKIPAMTAQRICILIEGFEQLQDFGKLLLG